MKFSTLVTLLPLFFSSSAVFAAPSRDIFRARQAHVKKDLVDVCVALDVDVQIAPGGLNILCGHVNLCLCLSVLPGFLGSNPVARTVVNHLGSDGAHNYFTNLIQGQQNKQQCHYPTHATPFCSIQSPCGFTCGNGYSSFPSSNPTQCVCNAPHTECNGVCGSFPHGCGSQAVSKTKRDQPTCSDSKTMCGVPGNTNGVDCVDTNNNVESCGGCTTPSPFGNNVADGKNCRDIPNIDEVSCDGTCKVISCKDGFEVSSTGDSCVELSLNRVRKARGVDVIDDCFDRLTSHKLLAGWYNIVVGRAQILASLVIIDYDHVLQFLLGQGAIIGVPDLLALKDILGIDLSVLRRDTPYTVDGALNVLLAKGLIVGCDDLLCIKGFLGAAVETFSIDYLLQLLVAQGLIVQGTSLLDLRELLGLGVVVL